MSDSKTEEKMIGDRIPLELKYTRKEVIYGRKFGMALTVDAFTPTNESKGRAILFIVSEGWYSDHSKIEENIPAYVLPFVGRGYTIFAVCHGSSPKFSLPEYIEDLNRAVRFIRSQAQEFGIDPDRIGSMGDSAGAHLSLMLGCAGQPGNLESEDPVDRESSQVQAVVAFFPPTDFLNWGIEGNQMLGEHPVVPLKAAFEFPRFDPETQSFSIVDNLLERQKIARTASPISHVRPGNAPTLLVHGDADDLIPLQQSQNMAGKLKNAGVPCELVVMKGGGHDGELIAKHLFKALEWFDKYL
jgi:acetyl esterase/lipase